MTKAQSINIERQGFEPYRQCPPSQARIWLYGQSYAPGHAGNAALWLNIEIARQEPPDELKAEAYR